VEIEVAAKKKAKKKKGPQQEAMPGIPVIDFSAAAELREVRKSVEQISHYTLDDKSVIHVKPALVDVRRAVNKYHENGQPIYFVKLGFAITTTVPKALHKGAKKTKKKKKQ
jgi:hypothetical protein